MAPGGGGTGVKRPKPDDDEATKKLLQNNKYFTWDDPDSEIIVQRCEKEKAPPYFIPDKDLTRLRTLANNTKVTATYKLTGQGIKIVCPTVEEYNKMGRLLKTWKYHFYTHDLPGSRPFKVVIRGLGDFSVESVTAALKQEKLEPLKVFKMTRRDQQEKNYRDHLFLVHFPKGATTLKRLKEIKALDQIIVQWETYRGANRSVTQCQNCLAFGHGTRNCFMDTRCTNCGGKHKNEDCIAEIKCGNCQGKHQGTDAKCPARNKFIEIRKKASGPKKVTRVQPVINNDNFPPMPVPVVVPKPALPKVPIPGFPKELARIFLEMSDALNSCVTRAEVIKTLGVFVIKYGR
ncbi:hypothetical protein pipiens_003367 [Culex pipiens pipiens]|uniref:Nucleic-acid-binding protein from transposon X-element n=1 Tax=Culex pipiens pipiens TaxID=38569 RepID=A0ABD1CZH7_CULPP